MKKAVRVEKHVINIRHDMYHVVDDYCLKSKNLYNAANYLVRQEFINNNKYIGYPDSSKLLKMTNEFKDIGSNSAQMTLKLLNQNWKSCFAAIKDWRKNSHKYLGRPNLPRYLKKNGRYVWVLTNVQSKVIDGYLKFSFKPLKQYNNSVKTRIAGKHLQTRFIPKGSYYVLEIVYEVLVPEPNKKNEKILGIDLGINRLATIQNNFGEKPISLNGRKLKSVNNFYNKQISKHRSIAKTVNKLDWTKGCNELQISVAIL